MTKKITPKELVDAISALSAADSEVLKGVLKDMNLESADKLAKAAKNLAESEIVMDHWQASEVHAGAKKEEIKTGPQAAASGDGAEGMIARYSETTPQSGTTLTAESLSRLLGPMASSMKAQSEALGALIAEFQDFRKSMTASAVAKAAGDDEESEANDLNASKAKKALKKAQKLITKAEDEDDRKITKSLEKEAAELFAIARGHARLAGDLELDKTIKSAAAEAGIKADISVVEEEDDDKEDSEKSKSMEEEQADDKEEAKGKDAGAAIVSAIKAAGDEAAAKLKSALEGTGMFEGKLSDVFDAIRGQSKATSVAAAPQMVKSETKSSLELKTEEVAKEDLNETDRFAASEILGFAGAVMKGQIPADVLKQRINRGSLSIQRIFKDFDVSKAA